MKQTPPAPTAPYPAVAAPAVLVAVRSCGLTDRGQVRETNEDNFLIAELGRALWVHQASLPQEGTQFGRNRGHIFLVADGMGGHQAGEVASALSLASIESFVLHLLRRFSNVQATDEQLVLKDFQLALRQADEQIIAEAAHHPELSGMGTTLTLAFVTGRMLFVIHAGDSRCYLFHHNKLRQLTADHTLAGELAQRGLIKPDEIRHHQWRHVVTNVLGGNEVGVRVEMHKLELESGDGLLLCTDGLTDMLTDEQIAAILTAEGEPRLACERLVAAANAEGGKDNITAVVARFEII
jgi:protein phosphatase